MDLAPRHPRPQFDERPCSPVFGCPGNPGEERGGDFNRPSTGGELAPVEGEDASETWQNQRYCEGLLGMPCRVLHQKELPRPPLGELVHVPEEAGDIECEWAMFHDSMSIAVDRCCGRKVVGACCGGNTRTHWWTLVVRDAVKLKKETYQALLAYGTPQA